MSAEVAPNQDLTAHDQKVVELFRQVRHAQVQEITDRAQASIDHDNRLELQSSYRAILGRDVLRLSEHMLYIDRHRLLARSVAPLVIRMKYVAADVKVIGGRQDAKHRAQADKALLDYYNRQRSQKETALKTPLLFVSDAEHIDGASVVHGWHIQMSAHGSQPRDHRPHALSIISSYLDTETGEHVDHVDYDIVLKPSSAGPIANMEINPTRGLRPAELFVQEWLDEDYLLPIGLVRDTERALGSSPSVSILR